MQRSISGKKQEDYYVHRQENICPCPDKRNRGTRGDSLLILAPLGALSRKPLLQKKTLSRGGCHKFKSVPSNLGKMRLSDLI